MADPFLDTASQRPPTGLDASARRLIVEVVGVSAGDIARGFFQDVYSGFDDYCVAVAQVWGADEGQTLYLAIEAARHGDPMRIGPVRDPADAMIELMPEPDFRRAVHKAYVAAHGPSTEEERIAQICRARGAPWDFTYGEGFVWVGDQEIEALAVAPAVNAIADPRFAGGVKTEFESARRELALGTPSALSQCVHQAGSAVESALKVVLDERGVSSVARDTAQTLFNKLRDAGLVENYMERLILAAATPRNQLGGHGAGAQPHSVPVEVAEAVLASAAVSIAFLRTLLP
jgi:hypothetical protein